MTKVRFAPIVPAEALIAPTKIMMNIAVLLLGGCAPDPDDSRPESPVVLESSGEQRRIAPIAWDTIFEIGGALEDTLLLNPRLLAGGEVRFYVYDYGDATLKAFALDGTLEWTFGGHGSGPGEFRNVFDVEEAEDGTVWALDGGNTRVTAIGPDGQLSANLPARGIMARDIIPLHDEILLTPMSPENVFAVALGEDGERLEEVTFPVPELEKASFQLRGTVGTRARKDGTWAATFPFGNMLLVNRGRDPYCAGRLIEGRPIPATLPESGSLPDIWAAGIFMADSSVFVLARGESDHDLRILDEYALSDCRYLRTVELPRRVVAATYAGGVFTLAYEDPAPGVIGLRPRD